MTTGIYGIFHGKVCLYIGQSSNIEKRWKEHLKRLRSGRALQEFQNWFDETDRDESKLTFGILERCSEEVEVREKLETMWFEGFKPLFYGRVPALNQGGGYSDRVRLQISKSLIETNKGKDFIGIDNRLSSEFECRTPKASSDKTVLSSRIEPRHELSCARCSTVFRHKLHTTKYCSLSCRTKRSVELAPELRDMYNKGYSLRQVGTEYGISYVTVRKRLLDLGVKLRTTHPSNRVNEIN